MNTVTGKPDSNKITALYERLSRDDEREGTSVSIDHQKQILEDYAVKNGFTNCRHFSDDGYSGGNFDRPGWQALISEVEAGNVATLIIKDMSRFGREYLRVGLYMEEFRERGVRLIAIADAVDTLHGEDMLLPFRNVFNSFYLEDCSRKVKAVWKARGMDGKRLTFAPIYGYKYADGDKTKWIINDEAAEVVRRIYRLTIEGKGPQQIARILSDNKVERPMNYLASRGIVHYSKANPDTPYQWGMNAITRMIAKPEYAGHTVNFRSYKDSYKDKRPKDTPKEDWVIFENTHPAIIDQETWETAQWCRKTVRRTDSLGEANPLTGLVFCADCGAKMYNHRKPKSTQTIYPDGRVHNRCPKDVYACSTYTLTNRKFDRKCTSHNIRTVVLRELALDAIKSVSGYAKTNEAEFVRQVREASAVRVEETAKAHKKRIVKEQKRCAELNTLFRKTYEDFSAGRLSEKRFELLSAEYEKEQSELEQSIQKLQAELDGFNADSVRADRFIELSARYTDFNELTAPMIHEFIEKIVVHEADKSRGEREQRVDIYLNFIGKFDVPANEPTPEELAEEEKQRRKRAQRRDAQRRYVERQKQNDDATLIQSVV